MAKNKTDQTFVWYAQRIGTFFSADSCKKDTIFGAGQTELGPFYFVSFSAKQAVEFQVLWCF